MKLQNIQEARIAQISAKCVGGYIVTLTDSEGWQVAIYGVFPSAQAAELFMEEFEQAVGGDLENISGASEPLQYDRIQDPSEAIEELYVRFKEDHESR